MSDLNDDIARLDRLHQAHELLREQIGHVIVGQDRVAQTDKCIC